MTIDIDNRLYNELSQWAKVNNLSDGDIKKYIEKAVRDRLNLDKYGDLNDKFKKEEPVNVVEPKVIVSDNVSQDEPINEPNDEPINEPINAPVNIDNEEPVIEKPKRGRPKKKIIQSK